ncbi:MAG: hypothetical protein ACTSPV_15025 [Candidatus Hodarchaeales archaeon]
MDKRLGHIQLTEELYDMIETKSKYDLPVDDPKHEEPEKPSDFNKDLYNQKSYIVRFDRLIDPVIIAAFYGLYKSKKLPPSDDTPIQLDKSYEFLANISTHANIISHFLFCLWIKENGYPNESQDMLKYRQRLYDFIDKLLDQKYFVNVILPFYINEANKAETGTSFLFRLRESGFVKWRSDDISPEYLAMEFAAAQEEFVQEVIIPLVE